MSDDWFGEDMVELKATIEAISLEPAEIDEILQLITKSHRRRCLRYIIESDEQVLSYDEIVDNVADSYPEVDDVEELKIQLHHDTIPRLREAGYLDYDPRSGTVRYEGDHAVHIILSLLDAMKEDQ